MHRSLPRCHEPGTPDRRPRRDQSARTQHTGLVRPIAPASTPAAGSASSAPASTPAAGSASSAPALRQPQVTHRPRRDALAPPDSTGRGTAGPLRVSHGVTPRPPTHTTPATLPPAPYPRPPTAYRRPPT